jgi:hypothetical protein
VMNVTVGRYFLIHLIDLYHIYIFMEKTKYVPPHLRRAQVDGVVDSEKTVHGEKGPRQVTDGPRHGPRRMTLVEPSYKEKIQKILTAEETLPWIKYSADCDISVWLDAHLPSKTCQSKVAWISVSGPQAHHKIKRIKEISPNDINWKAPSKSIRDQIDQLAVSSGYLSGKWLVFSTTESIDTLWCTIAKEVAGGTLGISCKVSPRAVEGDPEQSHVICIYTENYQDKEDVMRARMSLRARHGCRQVLTYKPDIYTELGVYAKNPWGIKPKKYKC